MNIRLNDLHNFLEVAPCRTMLEGAKRLQITQPALSESIKRLEKDLGETLFYRSRAGIALTPAGHEARRKGGEIMNALQELLQSEGHNHQRLITLGCHETVGSYFMPQLFEQLKLPKAPSLRLKHGLSREIQVEIQQGRIDVGIVVNAVPSPDLVMRAIAYDEFHIWHNPRARGHTNRVFCNPSLNQTHALLKKWRGFSFEIVGTESLDLVARMANAGLAYGVAPKRLIHLLGFHHLQPIKGSPSYKDTFYLVHRPEFGKKGAEKDLLNDLRKAFDPAIDTETRHRAKGGSV